MLIIEKLSETEADNYCFLGLSNEEMAQRGVSVFAQGRGAGWRLSVL